MIDKMIIIVTGSGGQLGTDVVSELQRRGAEVIGADLPGTDITDFDAVGALIEREKPCAVIHLAAYTAVDKAESEKELCRKINESATENLARICGEKGIKLLYTSTDYVFGGSGESFYETDDEKAPLNIYGETKLGGERAVEELCEKHFIVRISWVFGKNGKNFVYTMLRLGDERDEISVVCDQIGSPTYTADLAPLLCDMIESEKYGTYHATNEGVCSFAEFAAEIMRLSGKKAKILPISTEEYPAPAKRPHNSRLSKKSLDENGFARLPSWQDALRRFLDEAEL